MATTYPLICRSVFDALIGVFTRGQVEKLDYDQVCQGIPGQVPFYPGALSEIESRAQPCSLTNSLAQLRFQVVLTTNHNSQRKLGCRSDRRPQPTFEANPR